jgi:DUF1680 family protein
MNKFKVSIVVLLVVLTGSLRAQNKDNEFFAQKAIPVKAVSSLGGFFADRVQKNKDVYLKGFPIDHYLDFVRKQQHKAWDWRPGEQHGKWIESSIFSAAQSGDAALQKKVLDVVAELVALQEPEGYVGPTAKSVRTPEKPLRGMDPYELYFVFHALITVSEELGDPRGLEAAKKLGDYFLKYIGPGKAEFWPSPKYHYPENVGKELDGQSPIAGHSVHYSWEGTLLTDPMSRLYLKTGDKKYLDWCKWVVQNIDKWSGFAAFSKLDAVAEGKIGVHELQPFVHSHTFQMNFLGFLNLYQSTGDTSYLRKVKAAWDDIARRQMYITGGVSVAEHYEKGFIKPLSGNIVETCATMSWMQLTQYLLELTGDPKYADAMEKLTWNHVFAAQSQDGSACKYHTPPNGVKPAGFFREPDCCSSSGGRILSMMPTFIYAVKDNNVFINQFVHSKATLDSHFDHAVSITQKTTYPETEKIEMVVNTDKNTRFTLHVRIPAWCKTPIVKINGKAVAGIDAGKYAMLEREWRNGDKVEVTLPMELKWVEHENFQKVETRKLEGGEIMYTGVPDQKNAPYALMRGPLVYMVDNVWLDSTMSNYPKQVDRDVQVLVTEKPGYEKVKLQDSDVLLGPAFKVPAIVKGVKTDVIMLPFANAGKWYKDEANKGDKRAATYSYAIWLNKFQESAKSARN